MIMNSYRCVDRGKIQFDFLMYNGEQHGAYEDKILSLENLLNRQTLYKE